MTPSSMATNALAQSAYAQNAAPTRTHRRTEYDAIARITHRMRKAPSAGFGAVAEALHDNRQLWTILAADVADKANGLPASLRAQIFYLAEFTMQHSEKVLSDNASLQPLIEINTAILRGLKPGGAAA